MKRIFAVAIATFLFASLCPAQDSSGSAIKKVYAKWGFAVIGTGNLKEVKRKDTLRVKAQDGTLVDFIVTRVEKNEVIAELPREDREKFGQIANGDPVVTHMKNTKPVSEIDAALKAITPDDAVILAWNRQWGFVIYSTDEGTETISFDPKKRD